jgi:hypothetical protein
VTLESSDAFSVLPGASRGGGRAPVISSVLLLRSESLFSSIRYVIKEARAPIFDFLWIGPGIVFDMAPPAGYSTEEATYTA